MAKYEFQINMRFGEFVISACGAKGVVRAPSLPELLRRIMRKFHIRLDQIVFTFQDYSCYVYSD
jgi:hypothetical protein